MDLRRRTFSMALAATALTPGLAGAQAGPRYVRRDVYATGAGAAPLAAYARAVAAMKARPATDPTSWAFQANIHGTYDDPVLGPNDPRAMWSSCQHSNWHFLSWHRIYLHYFERIVRAASGQPSFALPYWNYELATRRALPPAFRTPTIGNALYVAARNDGSDPDPLFRININRGDRIPASVVRSTNAMAAARFGGPQGVPPGVSNLLESQPHNILHVVIGGDGLMSDPATAAQDPIFWLHHANIDRLWSRWARQPGRVPPSDTAWLDRKWTFFDERGARVEMSGRQILNTATQLDYRYDDEPATPTPAAPQPTVTETEAIPPAPVAQAGGVTLDRTRPVAATLRALPTESARPVAPESGAPTYLVLEGFDYKGRQSTWYEIYVNAPDAARLSAGGPYFAGNLGLFGLAGGHHGTEVGRTVLEIGDVLRRQRRAGLWRGGEVTVRFVPRGPRSATESTSPAPKIGAIRLLQQ